MNIKSEAKPSGTGQGTNGGGQGTGETVKWGKITQVIATWIGELIDIRWDTGQGTAKLEDARDKNGKPIEKEVPCTFCFCGQHWPFNSQAYQAEDPKSHSAFAFFIHDRALLVQRKPHAGEVDEDGDGWIYEAVAVITEKKDENGEPITDPVTGVVQNEVVRRWCWPQYRLEHKSFLLNAWYNYDPVSGQFAGDPFENVNTRIWYGYPFIDIDTRALIAPFVDQQGNERPLGSSSAEDALFGRNMRLVVTKEQQIETLPDGTQQPMVDGEGNPVWCYVPHGEYEFYDSDGLIEYVPDITGFEPNWKGRTVGLSHVNELLIDCVPVARLTFDDSGIQASYTASVRWVFHINDETNVLTVLRVTIDSEVAYRSYNGDEYSFMYCPYIFAVQVAIIDLGQYNFYDKEIQLKSRHELSEIQLILDETLSWSREDVVSALLADSAVLGFNHIDNISSPYHTAKAGRKGSTEGEFPVIPAVPAIDVELSFEKGIAEKGCLTCNLYRRRITLRICSTEDGECAIEKELGPLFTDTIANMSAANFDTVFTNDHVRVSMREPVSQVIAETTKRRIVTETVQGPSGEEEVQNTVAEEKVTFLIEAMGHEFADRANPDADMVVDADVSLVYRHRDSLGEFEVSRMRQVWQANRVTLVLTVFTKIDIEAGVYAFWEWAVLDGVDRNKLYVEFVGNGDGDFRRRWQSVEQKTAWRHYIVDRESRTLTHEFEYSLPHGWEEDMSLDDVRTRQALDFLFMTRHVVGFNEDGEFAGLGSIGTFPGCCFFSLPYFIGKGGSVAAYPYNNPFYDMEFQGYSDNYRGAMPCNFISTYGGGASWLAHTNAIFGHPGTQSTLGFTYDVSDKVLFSGFNLHPFPDKSLTVWPYWKTAGIIGLIGGVWYAYPVFLSEIILFSDGMDIHGFALEPGLWLYSFKVKGRDENPVVVKSEEMGKMLRCTGRDDTFFTLD